MEPAFRLVYVAHPKPSHPRYGVIDGAYATCWIREPVWAAADVAAREFLEQHGWDIVEADEHVLETEDSCPPGSQRREYFEQVQLDQIVAVFYTWPVGAPDADPDS